MPLTLDSKDYNDTSLLKDVVAGNFINKRYIKCPHLDKKCKWKLSNEHVKGYEYLNDACYLAGSFNLQCPK